MGGKMSEPLSQDEINKLLNAISNCPDENKEETKLITPEIASEHKNPKPHVIHTISIYDFKSPKFLNKNQEAAIISLFKGIADDISLFYTENLKRKCKVQVSSFDQFTYEEFLRSNPILSPLFCAIHENEFFVIETNPSLTEPVLNGTNVILSCHLSEMKKKLLKTAIQEPLIQIMLKHFRVKCSNLSEPQKLWFETNPQFLQPDGITPGSMIGLVTLEIKLELENINDSDDNIHTDMINFCLPMSYIKNVMIANKIIPEKKHLESKYSLCQKSGNAYVSLGDFQLRENTKLYPGLEIPLSTNYFDSVNIIDKKTGKIIGQGDVCLLDNRNYAVRVCKTDETEGEC